MNRPFVSLLEEAARFQVIRELIDESKTRKMEKYSIAYFIQHMDVNNVYGTVWVHLNTKEHTQKEFERLIQIPAMFEKVMSFTTVKTKLEWWRKALREQNAATPA
jgi:hypothetical protein